MSEREEVERRIYVASKTVHGPRWERLRADGVPIISTRIDEYYPDSTSDWADLWTRCVSEAASADALILYREPGEVLKGAWVEAGAARAWRPGARHRLRGVQRSAPSGHPAMRLAG